MLRFYDNNRTNYWLLFIYLTILSTMVSAQSDEVYLQDGNTVSGLIIEEVPLEYVKVQTSDYKVFTFYAEDIVDIYRPKAIKGYWDAIYTHNGGFMNGFIIEYYYNDYIVVENERGDEFEFNADQIEKITKEKAPEGEIYRRSVGNEREARRLEKKSQRKSVRSGETVYFAELGGMIATGQNGTNYPGIYTNQIYSYKINERFALGLGLGFDVLFNVNGQRDVGRVAFADSRFYFPESKLKPHFSVSGGYDWFRGGWTVFPGFGVNIPIFKSTLHLGAGLRVQQITENSNNYNGLEGLLEMVQFKFVLD